MTYPTMLRWALVPPILARASVSRLQVDALLRGACALKLGLMRDDRFEESLRSYFEACMPHAWRELVIEPHKQALYAQPKPYKIPLV
ncbi:MAG TPA: hypothetical protein VLS87_09825, partial [Woeseiaceae bacterium]|nr:hypothetical protein [Woeseiaceae bacterium]